jgi:hypothetical protein
MALLPSLANLTKAQLEAQLAEAHRQLEELTAAQAQASAQALPVNSQRLVGLVKAIKPMDGQSDCVTAILVNSTSAYQRRDGSMAPAVELPFDCLIANGEMAQQLLDLDQHGWVRAIFTGYWRSRGAKAYKGTDGNTYYKGDRVLEVLAIEVLGCGERGQRKPRPAAEPVQPTLEPINF